MPAPHDPKLREELTRVASGMSSIYSKGKYCPGASNEKCYGIDDLDERIAKGRDPKQAAEMWAGWHKVGAPIRDR